MKNLILLLPLIIAACQQSNYETFSGFEQGTTYSIVAQGAPDGTAQLIDQTFDKLDLTFSIFTPHSLISRINRNETDATSPLFEECFALAKEVWALSDGYFDPTVKPLVDAWGFGPEQQQTEPDVAALMEYVGFEKITSETGRVVKSDPRVQLDFSSIAKGFSVDVLTRTLESAGITNYMVEIGGEVRARGVNPAGRSWRIQIDKPVAGLSHQREAIVSLSNGAVATSGNYRNWFVDETGRTRVHTIDPLTGQPAAGEILSVSVAAASCGLADAWATALVASRSLETARRLLDSPAASAIEYYIITESGATYSDGFPLEKH